MDKKIENICKIILESKKFQKYLIEGIVLTGSALHGNTHNKSDIDIYLVVNDSTTCIRHQVFYQDNVLIQVRIYSYDRFVSDCKVHERKRPAYSACKVIYDKAGKCEKAINYSKKFCELGPIKLKKEERNKLMATIKNEVDTLEGLIESGKVIAAHLLINELVHMNIEYYNDKNNIWMTNNNYLYDELKENNKEMWLQINEMFSCIDIRKKFVLVKKLCNYTIDDFDKISGEYIYDEIIR